MTDFSIQDVLASYNRLAGHIVPNYESSTFEQIHPVSLTRDLLPTSAAAILDVGAGSGRDAAWFARRGHQVVAAEPSRELRRAGRKLHDSPAITWLDDRLPDLSAVCDTGSTFDLIWLSAIWMHVPPRNRARAFQTLAALLKPGGGMMFSLRLGPLPPERPMAVVSAGEIKELAREQGLEVVRVSSFADANGRPDISWNMVWLRRPEAGR